MKNSGNTLRIGIAAAVIVGTIVWLAFSGYGENKSYYVTIAELGGMGDKAYHSQLQGLALHLHPVQQNSGDPITRQSTFNSKTGTATVPALTTAVFVAETE